MTCLQENKCLVCESPCRGNALYCCGVCSHFAKSKDMTGTRHGKLTVIRLAGKMVCDRRASTRIGWLWLCRCDCGKECIVQARYLTGDFGNNTSCGCSRHGIRPHMPVIHKPCKMCGEVFLGMAVQKYCSTECDTKRHRTTVSAHKRKRQQHKALKGLTILKTQLEELV
jgi:hypothetical protein